MSRAGTRPAAAMRTAADLRTALAAGIGYWRRPERPGRAPPDWIAVAVFFVVACAWSHLAARWGEVRLPGGVDAPRIDGTLLVSFGPVLGALVAGLVRPEREGPARFFGRDRLWASLGLGAPILLLALVGARRFHLDPHLDAAAMMASLVLGCIGEELGWREWLFNALAGLPLWGSALVTWALWLLWHLSFLRVAEERLGAPYNLGFTLALLAMSFALAALMRHTGSSALAAAWHSAARAGGPIAQTGALVLLLGIATWRVATRGRRQALRRMSR